MVDAISAPFIPYTGSTVQLRHLWRTRSISTIRRTGREAPERNAPGVSVPQHNSAHRRVDGCDAGAITTCGDAQA